MINERTARIFYPRELIERAWGRKLNTVEYDKIIDKCVKETQLEEMK